MHEAGPAEDEGRQGGRGQRPPPFGGRVTDTDERPGRAVHRLTHFSTFSGIGGLDLGLERAGWKTLAFSEIDPYASAVLAERWPDIPNLGDIVRLADGTSGIEWLGGVGGDGPYDRVGREDAGHRDTHRPPPDESGRQDDAGADGRATGNRSRGSGRSGFRGQPEGASHRDGEGGDAAWKSATLWSGGFP